ncbi:MAG TPA: YetF domain-containing protein [Phycisphaerales bacterium]|nr:YetF domain-containing protein [Phycisphaerales bacterium]
MESVVRALVVYSFLLLLFRIAGKRTLSENTNFDLVLLLIISETTQQAMVDSDHSVSNGFLLITTLVGTSIGLSLLKQRIPVLEKWLDGTALVIVENGRMHKDRMDKVRVDEADVLESARKFQGLERLEQIKYAIVERNGEITIVPAERAQAA